MAHPPRFTLAGLLLGFLLFVAPSEAKQCKTGCHGMHTSNAYKEGHTYSYELEGTSVTSVAEAQGEATLRLNANVELAVKSDCIHQIRLKNVQINGAAASQGELEAHALQFNYHNGHIDTEVCAESGDTQAALNVKRAIISLFQDAIVQDDGGTTHHETDVFGGCPTDFSFSKNGETRTIKKLRNLDQCSYRENIKQDLIFSTFNEKANVKSTPILAADQRVEQQFNRGILNKAVSTETYRFKPFSSGEAAAKTVVETTLTLKGEKGGSPTAPVSEPKSLIFEAPHLVVRSSVNAIESALHATQESMPDAVTPEAARKFSELIKVLRQSSKNDILTVYSRIRAGAGHNAESAKKVFLDALFRTGTGESVQVAVELIRSRQFSEIESVVFYASLAFVRHANLASVTEVVGLLDNPELPRIAVLGIGSLIGKYCQEHTCENVPEVAAALGKLSSKLTKATTRDQENVVIAVLKGLGNTRYLDDATLIKVAGIAADKRVHNRVRVAALEALPTRCSMEWKELIFPTFADRAEDSEIRIKAYLSLVACPCSHVANTLKEVLDKETVNQVGSFITSHLRNLRASTNPEKDNAKRHLGLIKPRTKFPEDFRKFSYNNEFSYNINAFGVGSSVESNVIYSQNSFLPRSTSLNFTTEVFGRTFNFLQLDGRSENLDLLLERYLGPKGLFSPSNLKDALLDGRKTYDEIIDKIKNRFNSKVGRQRRDVSQRDIENFARKVKLPETELDDTLELDLSIKLFGAELAFLTYQGHNGKLDSKKIVDQILDLLETGVDKAKNFDYHLHNHLQFLDAELVYPTGLGLPLSVGVTGTSAVHLKTRGKIDLIAAFKNPESAAVQFALEPSASIEIVGSLVVEGYGIESGLKVVTTLHTATGTDISLKLLNGNGIDINFGVPKQKQELITVSSEVLISSGAKGDNYVSPKFSKGQNQADCFEQFSAIIGFTVCGELSYPYDSVASVQKKPSFPFSGPAKLSLYLKNDDVKSYHFKAYYDKTNPKSRSLEILLETPNSRTNRKVSFRAEVATDPDLLARVSFDSPFKKVSAEAVLKNNDREQTIALKVNHDSIEYFVRAGVASSGNRYRPVLEYKIPEHVERLAGIKNGVKNTQRSGQQYNVGGVIDVSNQNGGRKYVFNRVVLTFEGRTLIGIDGDVALTKNGASADLKVEYNGDTLALKGSSVITDQYNHRTGISLKPTRKPEIGFSLSLDVSGDKSALTENLVFVHGSDLDSTTNRFTFLSKHNVRWDSIENFDISVERKITYPAFGLVAHVEAEATQKSVEYDLEFKYGQFVLESEFSGKTGTKKPGDYNIDFEAKLQANSIKFKTSRDILGEHKNKFETSLELQPGGKYEVEAVIDHLAKPNDVNTQVSAVVKYNEKKIVLDAGLELNPSKTNSRAVITVENNKYLDFLLLVNSGGTNPNGNLKLNLKEYLIVNGQFQYQKDSGGNSHIEINIPKFNRKITGDSSVRHTGSKHLGTIEILYDASKDPSKRIKFTSDSDLKKTSFDSKNTLEVLTHKLEVNAKGAYNGQLDNGHSNLEIEIASPCGRYLVGKGTRDVTTKNDLMDGKINAEFIDYVSKGGKNRKLILHAEVHELNIQKSTYSSKQDLQFVNFDGQDIRLKTELKNLPEGSDKKAGEAKIELTGSRIPTPFAFEISRVVDNNDVHGTGKLKTSLGNKLSLQADAGFNRGNEIDIPATFETVIEVKLPSESLKNVKLALSGTGLIPKEAGSRSEATYIGQLTYNNDKTIKFDSHFTSLGVPDSQHVSEGSGKVTVTIFSNAPITVSGTFKHNPLNKLKQSSSTLNVNYDNKQISIATDGTYDESLSDVNFAIKIAIPHEKIRSIDWKFQGKCTGTPGLNCLPRTGTTEFTVIGDQTRYSGTSEFEFSVEKFNVHSVVNSPEGKTENILKIQKTGEKAFTGELKLSYPEGFVNLDVTADVSNVDDFHVVTNFDSDKLETRKIHTEISNKQAKGGKRIVINVTSNGKNIVSGSTNYKKRSEGGKVIVEGNGSVRIRDSTKSSSFKFTRQDLTADVDGENGIATSLNCNFGPSTVISEFKATNKEFYVVDSYCEENADCAHLKIKTKTTLEGLKRTQESTVEVDLRKFNLPYEFGIKDNEVIDVENGFDKTASLYLHSSKGKIEYTYQAYGHPTGSGIIITLPSRELALISTIELPKNKRSGGYKIDISAWLDRKRNPKDKTSLTIIGDVTLDQDSGSITGESKFTYPSQTKDLSVKGKLHFGGAHLLDGNLDIDVFAKKNQKIAIVAKVVQTQIENNSGYNISSTLSIYSQGQRLKVDVDQHLAFTRNLIDFGSALSYTDENQRPKSTGIQFSANLQEAHLLIFSPDKQLIKADSQIELTKNSQKVETDVAVFGREQVVHIWELRDFNSFKYSVFEKNKPQNKLEAAGHIVIGEVAEVHAEITQDGVKNELFHLNLRLDERNYLKPDFVFNKKNIGDFFDLYRTRLIEIGKVATEFVENVIKEVITEFEDLLDHLAKAKPNLKPLLDHYVAELNKLKEELNVETEGIRKLQAKLNELFGGTITAITEVINKLSERYVELTKIFSELKERLSAVLKSIQPEIQKVWRTINAIAIELIDEALAIVANLIKNIVDIINANIDEFKQIAVIGAELVQDIASIIIKGSTKIQTEVENFFTVLSNELKALPIYQFIKQKYEEILDYKISDGLIRALTDIVQSFKQMLPTRELQDLVTALFDYIVKHAKKEKVDDLQEIKQLYSYTLQAIKSIIELLKSQPTTGNFIELLEGYAPLDLTGFSKLPGVSTLKISLISLLRNNELPGVTDLFYSYRPTPIDITFSKYAVFGETHHRTFDGRLLSIPGTCGYVLAQDARDGNFSIVAEISDTHLKSITISEPTDTITFDDSGKIFINNRPAEFPANTKNLHASLKGPIATIVSDYGVQLDCSTSGVLVCSVIISGFYHGRVRGLLGNANNEPWDDWTLPSGKIVEEDSEFANSYKLKPGCPDAQAVNYKNPIPHDSICTEFFTTGSQLSFCFNFVDVTIFRSACDASARIASASEKKAILCKYAEAYVKTCVNFGIPVPIPPSCVSCRVGNEKINIGDSFSVEHPKKQADVIFVVEQVTGNAKVFSDLIAPLMNVVKAELKDHGITDVHIGLIGYGEQLETPEHYTVKGSRNIDGEVRNMKFADTKPAITYEEAKSGDVKTKLEYLKERLIIELGTFKLTDAYEEALAYDFRPGATKSVVGVFATPCEKSPLPVSLQQLRLLLGQIAYSDLGLTYHQIARLDNIQISGKVAKNVVGYDADSVFTFADSKKKPIEGSSKLKNDMTIATSDVCADFAANSGGAAFNANNFLDAKANQKKQFIQVVARRIVDSLVNIEIKEDCVCRQPYGLYPKAECKIVSRKEKEAVAKPTKNRKG